MLTARNVWSHQRPPRWSLPSLWITNLVTHRGKQWVNRENKGFSAWSRLRFVCLQVCAFCVQPSRRESASQLMSLRPGGLQFQHTLPATNTQTPTHEFSLSLSLSLSLSHTHTHTHTHKHTHTHTYAFTPATSSPTGTYWWIWRRAHGPGSSVKCHTETWGCHCQLQRGLSEKQAPTNLPGSVLDGYTFSTPPFIPLSSPQRWNHPHTENGRLDKMSKITQFGAFM